MNDRFITKHSVGFGINRVTASSHIGKIGGADPLADNDFQKDDDFCSWGERREK